MTAEAPQIARRRVELVNPQGLHARPAAQLVQQALRFPGEVALVLVSAPRGSSSPPGTRVDAKQMLELMFLGAPQGSVVDVEASGPDAQGVVTALAELIADGFGER